MDLTAFHLLSFAAIVVVIALLSVLLFEPGLAYRIDGDLPPCDSHASRGLVAALVDSPVMPATGVEVLTNGQAFYPAQLRAIEAARRGIHLEAYVFHRSAIADRFLAALQACARAGVKVRLVIDAVGSLATPDSYFAGLRRAGGEVAWYQPVRWHTLKRFNHRTHRELLVLDGATGFIGGAGVVAWWDSGGRAGTKSPPCLESTDHRGRCPCARGAWRRSIATLMANGSVAPMQAAASTSVGQCTPRTRRERATRPIQQMAIATANGFAEGQARFTQRAIAVANAATTSVCPLGKLAPQ